MLISEFGPAVAVWDAPSTRSASRLVPIPPAMEPAQIATSEIRIMVDTTEARYSRPISLYDDKWIFVI